MNRTGLTLRLLQIIDSMQEGTRFTSRSLVDFDLQGVLTEADRKPRAITQGLSYLKAKGLVEVVDTLPVENYYLLVYAPAGTTEAETMPEPEVPGQAVTMPTATGTRLVHFPDSGKPFRERREKREWRGYSSGLSWIK
jgi:hypothetical protein